VLLMVQPAQDGARQAAWQSIAARPSRKGDVERRVGEGRGKRGSRGVGDWRCFLTV
jgi:hypothetical protein